MTDDRVQTPAVARPPAIGELRRVVAAYAKSRGAAPEVCQAVRLAVGEALTNVVMHAYLDQPPGPMRIEAWIDARGQLRVLVCDEGVGLVPRLDSPGLGLGIPLMVQMADDVHVADRHSARGTIVSLRFSLDRSWRSAANERSSRPPAPVDCERPRIACRSSTLSLPIHR